MALYQKLCPMKSFQISEWKKKILKNRTLILSTNIIANDSVELAYEIKGSIHKIYLSVCAFVYLFIYCSAVALSA